MDRRNFLTVSGGVALGLPLLASSQSASAQAAGSGDAALNAVFDRIFDRLADMTPVTPGHGLHQMVDCELGGHLPGAVSADAIGEDSK